MENKKGINFFFAVIAIITGSKLYQHFDFQKWTFEKPALDIIYLLTFIASIFFIVKDYLKPPKK
jgi:hypothetical protein